MANITVGRKSGFVRRGGSMVRATLWAQIAPTESTIATASTAVLFTGFGTAQLAIRPFTVIRMRGVWFCQSDQSAASERQQVAFGASIVSEEALAIGVTAVPTPATNGGSDKFFLYEILMNSFTFKDATGVGRIIETATFDSKAMRKVEEGEDIAIALETFSTSSGAVIGKAGRILLKLH